MISAFTDEQKTQKSILSKVTFPFQELSVLASYIPCCRASLVAQRVSNLPAMQEIKVWSLGQEDPLEKGMANPSSSKVMLKILQARLQQYVNHELPDVQAGLRKSRGTRDHIANICWIIKKAREFQKNFLLLFYWLCQSLWLCGSQYTVENSSRDGNTRPPDPPLEKPICRSGNNS